MRAAAMGAAFLSLLSPLLLESPAWASAASATHVDFPYHGLAIDLDVGLSVPAADGNYRQFADTTLKVGLHAGWEMALHKYFLLEPEIEFDVIPVNTDDGTFNANNIHFNPTFTRIRFLAGARIAARFGKVEPFLRLGFGVDYIGGSVLPPIGDRKNFSSTGFVFKPGLGVQGEVWKHVVVGGEVALPVAPHNFGDVAPYFNSLGNHGAFTAFDIEIVAYAGFRY